MTTACERILTVSNLKTYFRTPDGIVRAVDDVSFHLNRGEVLALVGESGCGKSVTAHSIMGLVKAPPAKLEGSIVFDCRELIGLSSSEYRKIRGMQISMVFQEPMSSFDPLYTVGEQLMEVAQAHMPWGEEEAKERIIETLRLVHIPEPDKRYSEYPHQMSGGMLQRIMIAMALITSPKIIIADEPTTALDVTIQAQVLNLMQDIQSEYDGSIIFITHDLGTVAEIADRVHVMYAGKIVEKASVVELFDNPLHPYTAGLLASRVRREYKGQDLPYIEGYVPRADQFPEGCRFNPRCLRATAKCRELQPPDLEPAPGHTVACWLYEGGDGR
ncbi:MAG TPA: ABC transporter ATP-binding protein [Bacillota bacterium]|jgi:peptide/nickel transport system ATP-binding protein|nr:ABC transporter ATP-binding protein [Bacillota bacterium]HOK70977.1 ABC transporter ATP-binding protein [Bacillota bacterium]HOL51297.1 ABC transporter ATP-binding protein [Bacillota bacterium]HPQ03390.1 ABC transporter ATP-binding protein [Bacillota bacterium]HPZ13572.1 ABC transporter ATP-binding protein [Bacillota bacterium]